MPAVPDDIAEARRMREVATAELRNAHKQSTFVARISEGLINRRDENHYIELLYQKARGAS